MRFNFIIIQNNLDIFLLHTPKLDISDAFQAFHRFFDILFNGMIGVRILFGKNHSKVQNRFIIFTIAMNVEILDFVRKFGPGAFQPIGHLGVSDVHIGSLGELKPEPATASLGITVDPAQVFNGFQIPFQGLNDLLFYFLGIGIGVGNPDA